MIGSSQVKLGKSELACGEVGFCNLKDGLRFSNSSICFGRSPRWKKAGMRFTVRALQSEAVIQESRSCSANISKSVSVFFFFPL